MSNTSANAPAGRRIDALLDPGSFVELAGGVTSRSTDFNEGAAKEPSDGVITGYGLMDGRLVYIYSQNAAVMKGTVGEMHAQKIIHLYNMAMKMGAPVIGLIDSAGFRLTEATDVLEALSRLYYKMTMASGVIPQISAIFGTCGGGMAVAASLSDFVLMDKDNGRFFLNAPNAIPGKNEKECDLSKADFQSAKSGNVDYVGDESEVLGAIRQLVGFLPSNCEENDAFEECTDDLNRLVEVGGAADDPGIIAYHLADNNLFFETKKDYAKDMMTGFLRLGGMTVGVVANRKKVYGADGEVTDCIKGLTPFGCYKAASFVSFCDAFEIPVLTLSNVSGFHACEWAEQGLGRTSARLVSALANASVPKVNVITSELMGSPYSIMNSKALGADMVYAWEGAKVGMMDAEMAAKILNPDASADELKAKKVEYAEKLTGADAAYARGYVDAVIDPAQTRKYLVGAFDMLLSKKEDLPFKKHGTK